jgi:hypothetical protein
MKKPSASTTSFRVLGIASLPLILAFALAGGCGGDDTSTSNANNPDGSAGGDGSGNPDNVANGVFTEKFFWGGVHAATVNKGAGTTVWWNADAWDVRGDTDLLSTDIENNQTTGYYTDIPKAASADPHDPTQQNDVYTVGGDGSPGIGIMRVDEQGISSARLRNPMLIAEDKPGVVTFYASRFVTTGHWWEIVITPAEKIIGAEMSSVPGDGDNCVVKSQCGDGLHGPSDDSDNTAGPGHRPTEPSINTITTGYPDIPLCEGGEGYHARFGTKAGLDQKGTVDKYISTLPQNLTKTTPEEMKRLFAWKVEYRPSGIDLYGDFNNDGSFSFHEHFPQAVPWKEVHVHLLALAYQADHHPQIAPQDCGWVGRERELAWRDVTVSPVKYNRTSVAPRDTVTTNVARQTGWMNYDLRDIHRFGAPEKGVPQANDTIYNRFSSFAHATFSDDERKVTPKTVNISVDLSAEQTQAKSVRFVYDIKGKGTATLTINGKPVGAMPQASTVVGAAKPTSPASDPDYWLWMWVRRDVTVDASLLKAGKNDVSIALDGQVALDRMQLEFGH